MGAVSIGLLAVAPANLPTTMASAVLFGGSFITITGMLGVWSVAIFHDRPSAGLGAMFSLMVAGQAIGPSLFGLLATTRSLAFTFGIAAACTSFLAFIRPAVKVLSISGTGD